ncbi:MAG: alpha/beta hydrolase [Candidatus Magnetomorum sp.]|nr:alpha/beta hydrolase [Candidatus Magnetomorum sp.]
MVTKYTYPESQFIKINNTSVHYCDQGEGPVLLLLHGMLASLHTWNEWVKLLQPHFRIIRLDLPGFGLTNQLPELFNRDMFVNFLNQFVEALDLKEFVIAGNSIGAYIAWNYALDYPKNVKKLILIDAVGYPQSLPWVVNFVNAPVLRNIASIMTPRIFIDQNVRTIYGDKNKVTEELIDLYYDMVMNSANRGAFVNLFRLLKTECSSENLSRGITEIKTPTLLMWGNDDPWVPVTVVKDWERDLHSSKTIIYNGVGHVPMEEIPEQTANDAYKFLKPGYTL